MAAIERLVEILAGHYRWGLHPVKLFGALLLPVAVVWVADRRLRRLSKAVEWGAGADPDAAVVPPRSQR